MILDTNAFLFLCVDPSRLSRRAANAIERTRSDGSLALSAISFWEIALLVQRGRFAIRGTIDDWLERSLAETGVATRDITPAVAALSVQFPDEFPRDPGDRIIAATARNEAVPLVTSDERIRECRLLTTIW